MRFLIIMFGRNCKDYCTLRYRIAFIVWLLLVGVRSWAGHLTSMSISFPSANLIYKVVVRTRLRLAVCFQ